ncbi:hypothetical protein FHS83_003545 [Rhizomicrobium palustre]|uniref:Uncharacterized protein n=1 Tax=Rhizomicrobium palustre TaxID=189966 RepID=A0A846N596_9PROT|nr:hypothetical protein [Rhizomicrobium palustre]NIK90227.1 hypothetical protein [Rhizomicrobium palustre]
MALISGFPAYFVGFVAALLSMPLVFCGAVVAVFFGLVTVSRAGLVLVPAVAAIVFTTLSVFVPNLIGHAPLSIPAFDVMLLRGLVAAYVVFLIADSVVFAVKKAILRLID